MISRTPWSLVLLLCLTLGLAPFAPPHVVEKVGMLVNGELKRPLDWADLLLHGAPWALLAVKAAASLRREKT